MPESVPRGQLFTADQIYAHIGCEERDCGLNRFLLMIERKQNESVGGL
jgi:hypothetical protein